MGFAGILDAMRCLSTDRGRGMQLRSAAWTPAKPIAGATLDLWMDARASDVASSGARQFTAANIERFELADNAAVSIATGTSFTWAGWINLDTTGVRILATKGTINNSALTEYNVGINSGLARFQISDGTNLVTWQPNPTASLGAGEWWFMVFTFDVSDGTQYIYINDSETLSNDTGANNGARDGTHNLTLGGFNSGSNPMDGRLSKVVLFKRPLTAAERTSLYNAGNGLNKASLDAHATLNDYTEGWDLNEASGNALSHTGANDLTDTNTVTAGTGPTGQTASDSSVNGNHASFDTILDPTSWSTDVPSVFTGSNESSIDGTGGGSLLINESGSALQITGDWTITGWVKGRPAVDSAIFGRYKAGKGYVAYFHTSGILRPWNDGANFVSTTAVPDDGAWHFVAMSSNSGTATVRVDSTTETGAMSATITNATLNNPEIGNYNDSVGTDIGVPFNDVRVYNSSLSTAQLEELKGASEATGATPVGHWKLNDGPQSQDISDGDPVLSWLSREGNTRLFEQATTSKRPTYTASAINAKPGITFDGTDDLLRASSAFLTGTAGTIFIVFSATSNADDDYMFSSSDEALATKFLAIGQQSAEYGITQNEAGTADTVDGDTATTTADTILMVSSSGTAYAIRVNGNVETESADSGSNSGDWFDDTSALDNAVIGAMKTTSEGNHYPGVIAEILVYDSELSAGEIALVETYLADKFGITLP